MVDLGAGGKRWLERGGGDCPGLAALPDEDEERVLRQHGGQIQGHRLGTKRLWRVSDSRVVMLI